MKVINTYYNGYKFRSRLEARWAVFFNALGVKYSYESEGFDLGHHGRYLPDFLLPDVGMRRETSVGVWAEIKAVQPDKDTWAKYDALVEMTRTPLVLLCGLEVCNRGFHEFSPDGWDSDMAFMQCLNPACGHIKVEYGLEGSYCSCPKCGSAADSASPAIEMAIAAARSARFEHGESPRVL